MNLTTEATSYRSRALALFVVAHTLLAVDRSIMAVMLEPIRHEFALSDSQLGFLSGIAFAFFFGIAGLPLGWLVDRFNRRNILAASVGIFSVMTAAAGATTTFVQLAITRLFVGAGEAGGGPAMLSMISDLYPANRRASAIATYYAGTPIGGMLILFAGGWIATNYGWRAVFLIAGLPGILLAVAILLLKEPARPARPAAGPADTATYRETIGFIWSQRALRHLLTTAVLTTAATAGLFSFTISLLVREQGASLAQAGTLMAAGYGVMGLVGTSLSGRIVDRLAYRDERWRTWFCAACCFGSFPAIVLMVGAPSFALAGVGLAIWALLSVATYGPLMALLQSLVAARMRGTISAIFYLLSYFVGVSIGPQLIGFLSDGFASGDRGDGLAPAMMVAAALYLWAALHFVRAGRTLDADVEAAAALGETGSEPARSIT